MPSRSKSSVPSALAGIDEGAIDQLKLACSAASDWIEPPEAQKAPMRAFKSDLKDHYYWVQARRCCYCSSELPEHKRAYDLEHVLSRSSYAKFMFDFVNLAVACVCCNGRKQARVTLTAALASEDLSGVPLESSAYVIVHPHFDEWDDYLTFDEIGRVVAKEGSEKGLETIRLCSIAKLNAARVADHFSPNDRKIARGLILNALSAKRPATQQNKLRFLRRLVENSGLESARVALSRLEQELGI